MRQRAIRRAVPGRHPRHQRRGMVLVVVLVAVAMLSLAGYTFAQFMFAEREAVWVHGRSVQARALADSGVVWIQHQLLQPEETLRENGGLYDNPDLFRGVLVIDDAQARDRGRFTILAQDVRDGILSGVRYGLENESSRLNLNVLVAADDLVPDGGRQILMGLPGMTEDTADAILDWIDDDDEQRPLGAERDYYSGLDPAYVPTNGPPATVEELLLVRGVTPELLFGPDADRNGSLDAYEPDGQAVAGVDNSDGSLNHGWAAYLTLYSQESNLRPDGTPRIDLNSDDLEQLYEDLAEALGNDEWAAFIVAFRQGSAVEGDTVVAPQPISGHNLDFSRPGNTRLTTVLDLIGKPVQAQFQGEPEAIVVETPFPDDPAAMNAYLPVLMDVATVNSAESIPGRINVNQAPRTILAGIPGMEPEVVNQVLNEREPEPSNDQPGRRHETWLLAEGLVTLDQMKQLMPFVTAGGSVFRAQVIGYFDQSGPARRMEMVIDAIAAPPRLVFWRDLSHLGRGYSPEMLGIQAD